MSLISRNWKEDMNGNCFVSSGKLFHAQGGRLSLMERKNYSIRLCEHGEFVCHQRSVGCS